MKASKILQALIGIAWILSTPNSGEATALTNRESTALKFKNSVVGVGAKFEVYSGVVRIGVIDRIKADSGVNGSFAPADEENEISTDEQYTISAAAIDGTVLLNSCDITIDGHDAAFEVSVVQKPQGPELLLMQVFSADPGIMIVNDWDLPVQFRIERPNSPFVVVTVLDDHNFFSFNPPHTPYTAIASIDGVVIAQTEVDDPDATVTLVRNGDDGFSLVVSDSQ